MASKMGAIHEKLKELGHIGPGNAKKYRCETVKMGCEVPGAKALKICWSGLVRREADEKET